MEAFVNDEKVIGKWKYLCSALNKEKYFKMNNKMPVNLREKWKGSCLNVNTYTHKTIHT